MQWFLDFDDTLVIGPITWAIDHVLPTMISENNLTFDEAKLAQALLDGQQQAAAGMDEAQLLNRLFDAMVWPKHLQRELAQQVFSNYTPTLFDDAQPFLQRLVDNGHKVYLLSNNNHAPAIAGKLGLHFYIADFFTPKDCALERGKPHRDLWDCVCERYTLEDAVLVGDDPWSDGAFAEACGISCYLVDRLGRFAELTRFPRVRSLSEIEVPASSRASESAVQG